MILYFFLACHLVYCCQTIRKLQRCSCKIFLMWIAANMALFIWFSRPAQLTGLTVLLLLLWASLLWKFIAVSSHILIILIILEFLILVLFLTIILSKILISTNIRVVIIFITLAVCEARLGLGLLILLSRKTGTEQTRTLYPFKLNKL